MHLHSDAVRWSARGIDFVHTRWTRRAVPSTLGVEDDLVRSRSTVAHDHDCSTADSSEVFAIPGRLLQGRDSLSLCINCSLHASLVWRKKRRPEARPIHLTTPLASLYTGSIRGEARRGPPRAHMRLGQNSLANIGDLAAAE